MGSYVTDLIGEKFWLMAQMWLDRYIYIYIYTCLIPAISSFNTFIYIKLYKSRMHEKAIREQIYSSTWQLIKSTKRLEKAGVIVLEFIILDQQS